MQLHFISRDTRLSNMAGLSRELGLDDDSDPADILVEAWSVWGVDCLDRFRGAYAFAIRVDGTDGLIIARDVFGLAPLYFANLPDALIVADSSRRIREASDIAFDVDLHTIADFVAGQGPDHDSTFFKGIFRLRPGCRASVTPDSVDLTRYWRAESAARTCEDPVGRFRDLFDMAVRQDYVDGESVMMLSGGLDSSAITASVRAQGLAEGAIPCISMTYDETENWSDGRHLRDVADHVGARLTSYPSDEWDPLADMEFWLEAMDGPYLPRGHSVSFRLLKEARKAGYSHVFSGHGGDEIVSQGFGRLNELARRGRWWTLWRETRGAALIYGAKRWQIMSPYLSHNSIIRRIRRRLGRRPGRQDPSGRTPVDFDYVSINLRAEPDGDGIREPSPSRRPDHDDQMLQRHALTSPIQGLSLEIFAICSRAAGVRTIMPFYNRDLAELSLSLPSHWKLRYGLTRFILRETMRGRLPESVRLRGSKFDFTENFRRGLFTDKPRLLTLTNPDTTKVSPYVNTDRLQRLRADLRNGRTDFPRPDLFFLWRVAVLGMWLEQLQGSTGGPGVMWVESSLSGHGTRETI